MPKFDLYNGHGDPVAHLRSVCSKMRGAGGRDELLMEYFSQSLGGSALEWYTRQDHRRSSVIDEDRKEARWREQVARVDPPMKETIQELIDTNRIEVQAAEAPNNNQNPLAAHHETHVIELKHKGGEPKKPSQTVMMIRSSEVKSSEKSTSGKSVIQLKRTDNKPSMVVDKGSSGIVAVKPENAKVVVP
uniref:Uncharacterized protein LOC104243791 n=1 Tax=Nicotiana sylvestris TaxID=4096 RepID=A0A1U7XZF1_NICSY